MSDTVNIQSTTEYDKFKFLKSNRQILPVHLARFSADTTFPTKFKYSPILVNKDFEIIDGQHRFLAAKKSKIPVYYIQDMGANLDDIRVRNSRQMGWKTNDYIDFYRHTNKDFQLIYDLKIKYSTSYSLLMAVIEKFFSSISNRGKRWDAIKQGDFALDDSKKPDFLEFIDILCSTYNVLLSVRKYDALRPYLKNTVISSFAHYYLTNRPMFYKCMKKLPLTSYAMPFCGSFEQAKDSIRRLYLHKERINSKVT